MLSGPRQKFAEGIAAGLDGAAAYRAAYPASSRPASERSASRLLRIDEVKAEIARLRAAAASLAGSAVLTLASRRERLAALICSNGDHLGRKVMTSDWLRAMELDAKLAGELKDKVEVTGETIIRVTIGA